MAFYAIMKEKAVRLRYDEVRDEEGWQMVIKIWKVPAGKTSPDGVDYSLSFVSPAGERAVGYDNHWPKGHHRHMLGKEGPYAYRGVDTLIADFTADMVTVRRIRS